MVSVKQIPEHLCCKITMDIFRDPVITPSGVSYERAVLYEHFRKVSVDLSNKLVFYIRVHEERSEMLKYMQWVLCISRLANSIH